MRLRTLQENGGAGSAAPTEWRVGSAGWSVPRAVSAEFTATGTHLQRYAARFRLVEINSSFYRPHRRSTYERWADSVAGDFLFVVKVPRAITHDAGLRGTAALVDRFLEEVGGLGARLGALLVQLPPKLELDRRSANAFFAALRARYPGHVVLEPRHPSWFSDAADELLCIRTIARAAADPCVVPEAGRPGGWRGLTYHRLHGSPDRYWSSYGHDALRALAADMLATQGPVWCIFDNTASGAAAANGLELTALLEAAGNRVPPGPAV